MLNVCNGFFIPSHLGAAKVVLPVPGDYEFAVGIFSKMENELSPFLSGTFGTFIIEQTPYRSKG